MTLRARRYRTFSHAWALHPIFGTRLNRRMGGKLATVIDRIEHGHHVFRAYFKHAFLKQYEKFAPTCATSWSPTTSPISG
jgi:hypothetical protein